MAARSSLFLLGLAGIGLLVFACDASSDPVFGSDDDGGGGNDSGGSSNSNGGSSLGGGLNIGGGGGVGNSGTTCDSGPDDDSDMDGYTVNQGDCNDCDANVNPGAIEVEITEPVGDPPMVPEPADEDCDGTVDNVAPTCDGGIAIDDGDAMNGAASIELCQIAGENGKDWGLVSSDYVRANGTGTSVNSQIGILDSFGPNVNVQGGSQMLVLSSGRARLPGQAGSCGDFSCDGTGGGSGPPGYPQNAPGCPIEDEINDDIGLQVTLKAPSNATGYSFNFKFYSFEYPEWVCTSFNDQFMAFVTPPPMGAMDGNISFDANGNPVSVNVAFFDVCPGCALGPAELVGTGFDIWDDAGATSWLQTSAPIGGGEEFSVRFAIWDTGDQSWDSTVLVDNFQWVASGGTVAVGTDPVPDPK